MYCSKCGAQNDDNAAFCAKCGAPLKANASPTMQPQTGSQGTSGMTQAQRKDPIVAAILNFFWGIGYLYLGYQKVMGIQTVLFVVGVLVVDVILAFVPFIGGVLALLIAIILVVDGYQKAKGEKGLNFINVQ